MQSKTKEIKHNILYIGGDIVSHYELLPFTYQNMTVTKWDISNFKEKEIKNEKIEKITKYQLVVIDNQYISNNIPESLISIISKTKEPIKLIFSPNLNKRERLHLLSLGFDDVICQSTDIDEIAYRARRLLSRYIEHSEFYNDQYCIVCRHFKLDPETRLLTVGENQSQLTDGEHQVLLHLIGNRGKFNTRQELSQALGRRFHSNESRSIDMLIGRLRKKILDDPKMPQYIVTSRGRGYMLTEQA